MWRVVSIPLHDSNSNIVFAFTHDTIRPCVFHVHHACVFHVHHAPSRTREAAVILDDADYYREICYPVLREVAEWVLSRGQFTARGFEIRDMGGPDESLGKVNNNAFTNVGAMKALAAAVACRDSCKLPDGYIDGRKHARWKRALDKFYLPTALVNITEAHGGRNDTVTIIKPFDEAPNDLNEATMKNWSLGSLQYLWTHMLVAMPAGAASTGAVITPALFNATYHAEEILRQRFAQSNGGIGSGSVPCSNSTEYFICAVYGALAAHFGDRDAAQSILASFGTMFMLPPYFTTTETRSIYAAQSPSKRSFGHYMTNWGSHLSAVLFGLTGLRISPAAADTWNAFPAALPKGWESITVERVWIKGEEWRLHAEHGKHAELTLVPADESGGD
jgi:hypothetical protein